MLLYLLILYCIIVINCQFFNNNNRVKRHYNNTRPINNRYLGYVSSSSSLITLSCPISNSQINYLNINTSNNISTNNEFYSISKSINGSSNCPMILQSNGLSIYMLRLCESIKEQSLCMIHLSDIYINSYGVMISSSLNNTLSLYQKILLSNKYYNTTRVSRSKIEKVFNYTTIYISNNTQNLTISNNNYYNISNYRLFSYSDKSMTGSIYSEQHFILTYYKFFLPKKKDRIGNQPIVINISNQTMILLRSNYDDVLNHFSFQTIIYLSHLFVHLNNNTDIHLYDRQYNNLSSKFDSEIDNQMDSEIFESKYSNNYLYHCSIFICNLLLDFFHIKRENLIIEKNTFSTSNLLIWLNRWDPYKGSSIYGMSNYIINYIQNGLIHRYPIQYNNDYLKSIISIYRNGLLVSDINDVLAGYCNDLNYLSNDTIISSTRRCDRYSNTTRLSIAYFSRLKGTVRHIKNENELINRLVLSLKNTIYDLIVFGTIDIPKLGSKMKVKSKSKPNTNSIRRRDIEVTNRMNTLRANIQTTNFKPNSKTTKTNGNLDFNKVVKVNSMKDNKVDQRTTSKQLKTYININIKPKSMNNPSVLNNKLSRYLNKIDDKNFLKFLNGRQLIETNTTNIDSIDEDEEEEDDQDILTIEISTEVSPNESEYLNWAFLTQLLCKTRILIGPHGGSINNMIFLPSYKSNLSNLSIIEFNLLPGRIHPQLLRTVFRSASWAQGIENHYFVEPDIKATKSMNSTFDINKFYFYPHGLKVNITEVDILVKHIIN